MKTAKAGLTRARLGPNCDRNLPMNSADDSHPHELPPLDDKERAQMEVYWYEGKMLPFIDLLVGFVVGRRDEILLEARGSTDSAALREAIKRLVYRRGSVHMASENRDQKAEMEKECWYRGQRGAHDRSGVKVEWVDNYGKAWRRWRVREYLFVIDRSEDRLVAHLVVPSAENDTAATG